MAQNVRIIWSSYFQYRAALRGFDLAKIESILRQSVERYQDAETGRIVVVGRHDRLLVAIPCDMDGERIVPVTVHATSRQQVRFRVRTGRWSHE